MKKRFIGKIPLLVFILGMILVSCATAPEQESPTPVPIPSQQSVVTETLMPLSPGIINRLRGTMTVDEFNRTLDSYQFVLFGRITLEREHINQFHTIENGQVRLVDEYIREIVSINDHTPGLGISLSYGLGNEMILTVSFDENPESQLRFSARATELDSFFHLVYDPDNRASMITEERGTLWFGGNEYKLRYSGDRSPLLLIRLTQREIDRTNARVIPGRRVP